MELEKFALLNAEAEDYSPIFAVSVSVYDFWNSPDLWELNLAAVLSCLGATNDTEIIQRL